MTSFHPDGDDPRTQYGALCWRRARGKVEVLLVTSRETGRWVIPKGWPIPDLTPEASAAREAWEEAGVKGEVGSACLGVFAYEKVIDHTLPGPPTLPCVVTVFPLRVTRQNRSFPEAGQRRMKWFPQDKAARKVEEPELQALIASFALQPGGAAADNGTKTGTPTVT